MGMADVKGIVWSPRCVYPVNVGFTQSRKAIDKLVKAGGIKEGHTFSKCDGHSISFQAKSREQVTVIFIDKKRGQDNQAIAVLAHECLHAVQYIKGVIGEQDMSAEAEAYLLQWIMGFVLEKWRVQPW